MADSAMAIIKEPLISPFGFKGAYLSELWQAVVGLYDEEGRAGIGVGVQSVLWSDPDVFVHCGEKTGNEKMAELTQYALRLAAGTEFASPVELIDRLFPQVLAYGREHIAGSGLRSTFALNALVAVDQAAWGLYSRGKQCSFKELIPAAYRDVLKEKQHALASIPLVPYGMDEKGLVQLLTEGCCLLKIKVGADPDGDGDRAKMVAWDKERLAQVHRIASRYTTPYTADGKIAYYLDANGRYDTKDRLLQLLDYADKIGALAHIVLFEEPFAEEDRSDVSDLPVRLAADESVHDECDARARMELGYGAFALKPVAKTMSMSLKIAKLAQDSHIPCFCADLTANPFLADWNKALAAHLPLLPGMKIGVIETNGHQNYRDWDKMKHMHPLAGAAWIDADSGVYRLDDRFYATTGGALHIGTEYEQHLKKGNEQS
ncbi:enolase C-terminal domain-like protein [Paenibacillus sp. GCM10027626]|uniref:enolase C-terminal domain-like protein n=1 Tax=Paenibacillus sp. GCM10027626 TaxID=3273411 RepID=UPI003635231E